MGSPDQTDHLLEMQMHGRHLSLTPPHPDLLHEGLWGEATAPLITLKTLALRTPTPPSTFSRRLSNVKAAYHQAS